MLVLQFAYKLIWLLAVGVPALFDGAAVPPFVALIFAGWVGAAGIAAPWRTLFGDDAGLVAPIADGPAVRKPR